MLIERATRLAALSISPGSFLHSLTHPSILWTDDVVTVVLRDVLRLCSKEELVSLACECVSYELEQGTSQSILSVKEELVR